jgi:hypothetical protein
VVLILAVSVPSLAQYRSPVGQASEPTEPST